MGRGRPTLTFVKLVAANNDVLDGGDGNDVIIGQRGDDQLAGGAGDDLVVGDSMNNTLPYEMDLPKVMTTLRLFSADHPADGPALTAPDNAGGPNSGNPYSLPETGLVIHPALTLNPQELISNAPQLAVDMNSVPTLQPYIAAALPSATASGQTVTPFIAFVPDVVHHAGALPGNDRINMDANGVPIADPGNDMIFGDNATFVAPVVSGLAVIDNAAVQNTNELTGALQALHFAGLDYDQYLHTHAGGVGAAGETNQINIGNDVINGGSGDDVIFGDDARVVVPSFIGLLVRDASLKATALAYYDYLRDFQQITVDVEYAALESQGQILNALVADAKASGVVRPKSGVFSDPHYHTLAIGNDSIQGGDGGDLIIGDAGVVLSPFLVGSALDNGGVGIDSVSKNTLRAVNSALSTDATLRDRALALAIKQHHSNPEANSVEHKFPPRRGYAPHYSGL